MRVIFETIAIPNTSTSLPDGRKYTGGAVFTAKLYAPGEAVPEGTISPSVADWRRTSLSPDGGLHITPPKEFVAPVQILPAVIPAAIISTLPDDHLLTVEWHLRLGNRP